MCMTPFTVRTTLPPPVTSTFEPCPTVKPLTCTVNTVPGPAVWNVRVEFAPRVTLFHVLLLEIVVPEVVMLVAPTHLRCRHGVGGPRRAPSGLDRGRARRGALQADTRMIYAVVASHVPIHRVLLVEGEGSPRAERETEPGCGHLQYNGALAERRRLRRHVTGRGDDTRRGIGIASGRRVRAHAGSGVRRRIIAGNRHVEHAD